MAVKTKDQLDNLMALLPYLTTRKEQITDCLHFRRQSDFLVVATFEKPSKTSLAKVLFADLLSCWQT